MSSFVFFIFFFFFNDPATTEIYTLSLHDALPIFGGRIHLRLDHPFERVLRLRTELAERRHDVLIALRSEEHTSELQSRRDLVCRLLLEKKKKKKKTYLTCTSMLTLMIDSTVSVYS